MKFFNCPNILLHLVRQDLDLATIKLCPRFPLPRRLTPGWSLSAAWVPRSGENIQPALQPPFDGNGCTREHYITNRLQKPFAPFFKTNQIITRSNCKQKVVLVLNKCSGVPQTRFRIIVCCCNIRKQDLEKIFKGFHGHKSTFKYNDRS